MTKSKRPQRLTAGTVDRARVAWMVLLTVLGTGVTRSAAAESGEWNFSGSAGVELRWFLDDAAIPGQLEDDQASLILEPEIRWRSSDRAHQINVVPFYRWDAADDERSHGDLREGYYRYVGSDWEILAGVSKVFWGVSESRHLVDVINQADTLEDIDEEDRLGQPMIQLALNRNWGRLEFFSLPGFRERPFPGTAGRLRTPFLIDADDAVYESGAGNRRVDWAVRWSQVFGDWDVGLHAFHGNGREPSLRFTPVEPAGPPPRIVPYYNVTSQVGVDVQYTREAWLFKLEAIGREGQGSTFAAAVGGFEYTFYQLGGRAADLGLLAELLYDGRDAAAPFTAFDDDTFVGARLAFNDTQDSSILLGAVVDNDDGSVAAFLEVGRRVGRHVTLELEGRLFLNVDPAGELAALDADSFLALRGSWNF